MPLPSLPRHAALFTLAALLCACHDQPRLGDGLDAAQRKAIESARLDAAAMERTLATLPPACAAGDARATPGSWLPAPHAAPQPGNGHAFVYSFDTPVSARAFEVALNPKAFHDIEKVEVRDAHGNWTLAWLGSLPQAPAGCEYVRLAQTMQGAHEVSALRLSFRPSPGTIKAGHVRVLQNTAAPAGSPHGA